MGSRGIFQFLVSALMLLSVWATNQTVAPSNTTAKYNSSSPSTQEKKICATQLVQWCNNTNSTENASSVNLSFYDDQTNTMVSCYVNSNGTMCLANNDPWFQCYPNHTLTYGGKVLNDSVPPTDDYICLTRDYAIKFSDNMQYNQTAFEMEMKNYQQEMQIMHQTLNQLQMMVSNMESRLFGNNSHIFDVDATIVQTVMPPLVNSTASNSTANSTQP